MESEEEDLDAELNENDGSDGSDDDDFLTKKKDKDFGTNFDEHLENNNEMEMDN